MTDKPVTTIPLDEAKRDIQKVGDALVEALHGQQTAADNGYKAGWNAALDAAAKLLDDGAKYRLAETHDHQAEDWSEEIRRLKQ